MNQTLQFALYCKTFAGDLVHFQQFLNSYVKYNKSNIALYVSVPESDYHYYKKINGIGSIEVITDETYCKSFLFEEGDIVPHGMSKGYANQQICKLNSWRIGRARNYLICDSDSVFIRNFFFEDFMADSITPYSVLVQDKDLSITRHYRNAAWGGWLMRQDAIKRVFSEVGLNDRRLLTCHGHTVFNASVLQSLFFDFMTPRGLSYRDLLEISPYEFTWYNTWLQFRFKELTLGVEPFFKTFHLHEDYVMSRRSLLRLQDLSEAYVGIVMNSKWQRSQREGYQDPENIHYQNYIKMMNEDGVSIDKMSLPEYIKTNNN